MRWRARPASARPPRAGRSGSKRGRGRGRGGPAGVERALALVALEWAAADSRVPATDALFELRPGAWIQLQAGGPDPLGQALLASAADQGVPALCMVADVALDGVFAEGPPLGVLEQAVCEDFEDLAQRSAAAVLQHLADA